MPAAELRPTRAAIAGSGIDLGKYRNFKRYEEFDSLADFSSEVARHLDRRHQYALITMRTSAAGHAIACVRQPDGRFNVFDPNTGSFETAAEELGDVLSGVFASFQRDIQQSMQQQVEAGDAYAIEVSQEGPQLVNAVQVFPATFASGDGASGSGGPRRQDE